MPLDEKFIQEEMYRRIALECGQRCFDYNTRSSLNNDKNSYLSSGEQVCFSRCYSKFMIVKELIDKKIEVDLKVEMPPILYNQNIPNSQFIY